MVGQFFVVPSQDDEIPLIAKEPSAAGTRRWKKARNVIYLPSGREVTGTPQAGAEEVTASDVAVTEKIVRQEVAASAVKGIHPDAIRRWPGGGAAGIADSTPNGSGGTRPRASFAIVKPTL